jgi:predicted transcriptional regulator
MPESAKDIVKQALDRLPDNATVEEALERILFISQIENGLAEADSGKTLSSEEVRKRLGL